MAKRKEIIGYPVTTARRIRKNAGGVHGLFAQEGKKPTSGNPGSEYFFELLEDMPSGHGVWCYADIVDWSKNVVFSAVQFWNWGDFLSPTGIIDGAKVGYGGVAKKILGRWTFQQGECIVPCVGEGAYAFGLTPPNGTVGQADYSYTPGTTGTVPATGAYSATGLPANWAIDPDSGEITGPTGGGGGIVGPAGDIAFIVQMTTPKSGGGTCTSTRRIVITIDAA